MLRRSTWHQQDYVMAHYLLSLKLRTIFLGFHFKWYIFMRTCQYLTDIPAGVHYGWCAACRSNKSRFSEIRAKKKKKNEERMMLWMCDTKCRNAPDILSGWWETSPGCREGERWKVNHSHMWSVVMTSVLLSCGNNLTSIHSRLCCSCLSDS